jgi:hydroxypyruvate reductase
VIELPDLHRAAREIFSEALKSVDALDAVRRAVRLDSARRRLSIIDTTFDLVSRRDPLYVIAAGKAALAMAAGLNAALGDRLSAGIITGPLTSQPYRSATSGAVTTHTFDDRWQLCAGGHPLPNEESLRAARASFELLRRAEDERALVIFLISGGGSAMIEWPRDEQITLEELRAANRALVSCGASIREINAVRRAFSAVKGGGLAACAPHADQVSLIVSDTGADDESAVASGPTFESSIDDPDAASIVARYELSSRLPASILRAIGQPPAPRTETPRSVLRKHHVLLDNRNAVAAAAEAARLRGFTVEVAHDLIEQEVAEGSAELVSRLLDLRHRAASEGSVACLISGGEFACPVKGDGIGGRNAETALRCAIEMDAHARADSNSNLSLRARMLALSAGTDGIDGNSPAAGAAASELTLARARSLGLDAQAFLDRSDAYTFFNTLGDAIVTGPTATNVRDLRIMLTSLDRSYRLFRGIDSHAPL